ncbi:MAG: sortase [Thermomicrobiales bacterium]
MRGFRHVLLPVVACLAVLLSLTAGVSAYSGGGLPGWGTNSGKDLKAGPLGIQGAANEGSKGEIPIAISIPDAGVDAEVEKNKIVDGQMLDPSGPWVVSWYQETAKAGDTVDYKNTVLSGHVDYWGVGPSVFQSVGSLTPGATISLTGENGDVFTYTVDSVKDVPAQPSQEELNEIVGKSDKPVLTIITCGGVFDYDKGEYESRTIVRATLQSTEVGAGQAGTAASTTDNTGVGSLQPGDHAVTKDDMVNVRDNPSIDANIVTTLNKDDTVTITGESQDADDHTWWPIETADGTKGWVVQDYLTPAAQ